MGENNILGTMTASLSDNSNEAIKEVNQSVQDVKTSLEGFTPIKDNLQEIQNNTDEISKNLATSGWFYEVLQEVLDYKATESVRDDEARQLQDAMIDSLNEIVDFNDLTFLEDKNDKKKKAKVSGSTKFDDLKDLPFAFGTLGAVLANAINDKNKSGEKKGISGFFKGLLEGVGGIAALGVALLAFAGATLIFNFVDWGKAVIGMLAFTVFTIGMVAMAKVLGKGQKDLVAFSLASLFLSAALGVFAVSLYMVSAVVSSKGITIAGKEIVPKFSFPAALGGIGLFLGFIAGIALVTKLVTPLQKDLVGFAKASLILSGALGVFGVSLYIVSSIVGSKGVVIGGKEILPPFNVNDAWLGLGFFGAFIGGLAVISLMVGANGDNFKKFAAASLTMTLSLVLFSFSLVVVSSLYSSKEVDIFGMKLPKIDIQGALIGLGVFLGFLLAFTGIAILANAFGGNIALFTGVSLLMSLSLVTFSVAMAITAGVISGDGVTFGDTKFTPPKDVAKNALIGIGVMGAFMLAFAGLGALFLVPFAGQALALGVVTASGILLTIAAATILMSKAMMLSGLAISGGTAEIGGETYNLKPYDEAATNLFFDTMASFLYKFRDIGETLDKDAVKAVKLVNKAVIPLVQAMDKMLDVVIKAGQNYDDIQKIVSNDANALDHLLDPVLFVILGHKLDGTGGLMFVAQNMDKQSVKVLNLVTKSITPIADAMGTMIDVVIKAANSYEDIQTIMASKEGIEMISHLLDPVIWLILGPSGTGDGGLMYVANSMSKRSAKVLALVGEAMVPLIDSMDKMLDVVTKAATLNNPDGTIEELVAKAMFNINLITIGGNGITGFIPLFLTVAERLQNTSEDAVNAINSMPSMVQALDDLVGVVAKAGELDPVKIGNGVFGLTAMTGFLENFIDTIGRIIPGGMGGFFQKLGSGDPIAKLKDAHEYLQPGGTFYVLFEDLANIAKNFDGKGFENLAKVSVVSSFTTGMLESSVNFKDIMSNISSGLKKFTNPAPIDSIAGAMQKLTAIQEIGTKFDPLYELANKQVALHSVASDLESIAASYERIGAADKLGRLPTDFNGNIQGTSVAEQRGSSDGEQRVQPVKKGEELNMIANILNEWNVKGVKVFGIETNDKKKAVKTINI
ncbi:MAG: hypothetical protein II304_02385 [Bacteroidales bacterium]|nr:hypothetical protein [Bacteroidales bacterium]